MTCERLDSLFSSPVISHLLVFTDTENGAEVGVSTLFLEGRELAYYYYAFYDLNYYTRNLGMFMMTSAAALSANAAAAAFIWAPAIPKTPSTKPSSPAPNSSTASAGAMTWPNSNSSSAATTASQRAPPRSRRLPPPVPPRQPGQHGGKNRLPNQTRLTWHFPS